MRKAIRVHVCDAGRKYLQMRYVDPDTGKQVWRSTKTTVYRTAVKLAGAWESELNEGRYEKRADPYWNDFRNEYRALRLSALKRKSARKITGVLNVYERVKSPLRLSALSARSIVEYQAARRAAGIKEPTIKSHTVVLLAAIRWAPTMKHPCPVP